MDMDEQARITREKYGDIIDMDRPISTRKKMSVEDRAAQFAPFAALTGYHESVEDTEKAHTDAHSMGGVETEQFID